MQYRIGELAEASGVNARNIRAYRERGLLDPPTRVGRAAIYTELHLSQLRVINTLLAKGFTSSHIADFFAAMRSGDDLADMLGLYGAFGPGGAGANSGHVPALPLDVEVTRTEARRMVAAGLACVIGGQLMLIDPELVQIVAQARDRKSYLATIVDVFASTQAGISAAVEDVDSLIEAAAAESVAARAQAGTDVDEAQVLEDYRAMAAIVLARQIDRAVRGPLMRPTG